MAETRAMEAMRDAARALALFFSPSSPPAPATGLVPVPSHPPSAPHVIVRWALSVTAVPHSAIGRHVAAAFAAVFFSSIAAAKAPSSMGSTSPKTLAL